MIGTEAVVKAPADGYMLLVASNAAITAAPIPHSRMPFDPQKDLTPILMLGQITPVMVVPSSLPVTSVQELIALAKAKLGKLNYGSFGNGTYPHVAMEDFKLRTGTQILHVPYKGATPAITALLRSEVAVLIVNISSVDAYVKAGTLRIIAAAGAERIQMCRTSRPLPSRPCRVFRPAAGGGCSDRRVCPCRCSIRSEPMPPVPSSRRMRARCSRPTR